MIRGVPHPIEILHGGGVGLACGLDGWVRAEELHGLFAADTRVLSTYRLTIGGRAPRMLARTRPGPSSAQWDMENPALRTAEGDLAEGTLAVRLRRGVSGALHDDLRVESFAPRPVRVRLVLQIDADFADLFEVKRRTMPPRLAVTRLFGPEGAVLRYRRGEFRRGLEVSFRASAGVPQVVGAQVVFDLRLERGVAWTCCVEACPEVDGRLLRFVGDPHGAGAGRVPVPAAPVVRAEGLLAAAFARGLDDLERLAVRDGDEGPIYVAAGAPWFMALFGRDSLVTALMTGLAGSWPARGALAAVGRLQARARDDFRDAEPGKLPHEMRHGELARFGDEPHAPYYGAHDAPALYALALWHAWRWTGDRGLVDRHLGTARAALAWCEGGGDADGDGLLEYRTRSRRGYRNQGWKDAGDAIVHADGRLAEPPLATVELQGYLFAAQLAAAELLEAAGQRDEAARLRRAAARLRRRVEEAFWMEDEGCYALALDGAKRRVCSVSSNPGHLLWCGLPDRARAARLGRRLLAPDMADGYGLRTLSAAHPGYNPLSYQRGSVWPHDTAIAAAGLLRYGLRAEAARLLEGVLAAAAIFEGSRLPELYCGFARDSGPPVPYLEANSPQAWAAAAPILAAQLLLGLQPDLPRRRCFLQPWLPAWLPRLEVEGVPLGEGTLAVTIARAGGAGGDDGAPARIERVRAPPGVELREGAPEAPLWGAPPGAISEAGG